MFAARKKCAFLTDPPPSDATCLVCILETIDGQRNLKMYLKVVEGGRLTLV